MRGRVLSYARARAMHHITQPPHLNASHATSFDVIEACDPPSSIEALGSLLETLLRGLA